MSAYEEYKAWLFEKSKSNCDVCECECCEDGTITVGKSTKHSFRLPFSFDIVKDIEVAISQRNFIVLRKKFSDINHINDIIYYNLTELETLRFIPGINAELQFKVTLFDNKTLLSNIFNLGVLKSVATDIRADSDVYTYVGDVIVSSDSIHVNEYMSSASGANNLKCRFYFDSTWDKFESKIIRFKDQYNHDESVELINDTCVIPEILLEKPGLIYIGVIGTVDNIKKVTPWSNSIRVNFGCNDIEG